MSRLRQWWLYLLSKRSEVAALDYKDAYMAKVIMDIHRLRSDKAQAMVPLHALHPIHRIDRESAQQATRARAQALAARREELLAHGRLDLAGPPDVAWELARAWPGAELHFVPGGHTGDAEMDRLALEATDRFSTRRCPRGDPTP